ncbi:pentapeptide repeat-containing protein [Actinophytocola sp.]|uniref:pentapeptide repeat-containing protein n=1 Tax=Actinophytocola sp. TaxID=1872138 RepID=UPI003D6BCE42
MVKKRRRRGGVEEHHVLSTTTIALWAAGLLLTAAVMVVVLWSLFGTGDAADSARLDVIRTAATIVVGTGGAAALLLTARRQRVTELDVKQKDHDATERRLTELYGKAADQLGSDKAPVRLAGLFALERLAQENPAHRQTIVDLVCAYLRMPARPPTAPPSTPPRLRGRGGGSGEEGEVRAAAMELLAKHLRPGPGDPSPTFWPDIDVNLSGATLARLVLTHCVVRTARFAGTTFVGPATFRGTTVERAADFRDARFLGLADFRRASLGDEGKPFRGASFEGEVDFGTQTRATLAGARTRTDREPHRRWPAGWVEHGIPEQRSWATLVPVPRKEDRPEPPAR